MKIPECSTNDACPMGYRCFVAEKCLRAQQSANQKVSQLSDYCAQINQQMSMTVRRPERPRDMTASDLGIVDQLLDDKVGMEP